MKIRLYLVLSLVLCSVEWSAQVAVNADGSAPDADAGLDIGFTDKGLLPPRVALVAVGQSDPLSQHVEGMVVYNTTNGNGLTPGLYVSNGSEWTALTSGSAIPPGVEGSVLTYSGGSLVWDKVCRIGGTGPGGGKIIFCNGDYMSGGGYEVAPADLTANGGWGCSGLSIPGATGIAIGTGAANTAAILAACNEPDIAARVASEYNGGGYTDWFLPSVGELVMIANARYFVDGLDGQTEYSTSSEFISDYLFSFSFNTFNGNPTGGAVSKTDIRPVRPIRQF